MSLRTCFLICDEFKDLFFGRGEPDVEGERTLEYA